MVCSMEWLAYCNCQLFMWIHACIYPDYSWPSNVTPSLSLHSKRTHHQRQKQGLFEFPLTLIYRAMHSEDPPRQDKGWGLSQLVHWWQMDNWLSWSRTVSAKWGAVCLCCLMTASSELLYHSIPPVGFALPGGFHLHCFQMRCLFDAGLQRRCSWEKLLPQEAAFSIIALSDCFRS